MLKKKTHTEKNSVWKKMAAAFVTATSNHNGVGKKSTFFPLKLFNTPFYKAAHTHKKSPRKIFPLDYIFIYLFFCWNWVEFGLISLKRVWCGGDGAATAASSPVACVTWRPGRPERPWRPWRPWRGDRAPRQWRMLERMPGKMPGRGMLETPGCHGWQWGAQYPGAAHGESPRSVIRPRPRGTVALFPRRRFIIQWNNLIDFLWLEIFNKKKEWNNWKISPSSFLPRGLEMWTWIRLMDHDSVGRNAN